MNRRAFCQIVAALLTGLASDLALSQESNPPPAPEVALLEAKILSGHRFSAFQRYCPGYLPRGDKKIKKQIPTVAAQGSSMFLNEGGIICHRFSSISLGRPLLASSRLDE